MNRIWYKVVCTVVAVKTMLRIMNYYHTRWECMIPQKNPLIIPSFRTSTPWQFRGTLFRKLRWYATYILLHVSSMVKSKILASIFDMKCCVKSWWLKARDRSSVVMRDLIMPRDKETTKLCCSYILHPIISTTTWNMKLSIVSRGPNVPAFELN